MNKRVLSLLLAMALCLGMAMPSLAADEYEWYDWTYSSGQETVLSGLDSVHTYSGQDIPKSQLTSFTIPDKVTSSGRTPVAIQYLFRNCSNLEYISMPNTITEIGAESFSGCSKLSSVVFRGGNKVKTIGREAFFGCVNLTDAPLADGLTTIGEGAFQGCNGLKRVTIPESVTSIGENAFKNCANLENVDYKGSVEQWNRMAPLSAFDSSVRITCAKSESVDDIAVTLPDGTGIVEISATRTAVRASVNAPVGAKCGPVITRLYTQSGQLVKEFTDSRVGTVSTSPVTSSLTLWNTSNGMTAGTVYQYEFSVTVNGTTYTSPRGQCRLAGSNAQTYTVSLWNLNNGTVVKTMTVTNGKPYGELPTLADFSGKKFDGWYTSGKVKVTKDTIVNLTGDQNLYANWKEEKAVNLHITDTAGSGGVVEISTTNAKLNATLEAPKGSVVSQWSVRFFNQNGGRVGSFTNSSSTNMNGAPYLMYLNLWTVGGTPSAGQALKYSDELSLTVGTVYEYEFSAVVDGKTYTSDRAKMRLSGSAPTVAFKDVPNWCKDSVNWAVGRGITNGKGYDKFAPNDTCTTAEILTFLYRAAGQPQTSAESQFSDVPANAYYCKPANWAKSNGLVSGSALGTNTPCTRATVVTYLWKLAGSPNVSYNGEFRDVPSGSAYAQAVAWAANKGITNGNGDAGLFDPNATCTRGQIVTFLYRAYGK